MEVSLQEATAAISSGDKKGAGEEHSKGSFHTPLEGEKKKSLPARLLSTASFSVCHTLTTYLQTKLKPENLPQTYGGGILPWPQISLMGVATLD